MKPFVGLLAVLAAACGGGASHVAHDGGSDAADDAADSPPATLEMGSGESAFEPTVESQHLKLYAGTQGGHHVWLSYRTQGLLPDDIRMTLDVVPAPPARPAHSDVTLDLDRVSDGEGRYEFVGWPAQILDPECAVGNVVTISLTLTDARGKQASGSMTVIPDPPEFGFTRSCTR